MIALLIARTGKPDMPNTQFLYMQAQSIYRQSELATGTDAELAEEVARASRRVARRRVARTVRCTLGSARIYRRNVNNKRGPAARERPGPWHKESGSLCRLSLKRRGACVSSVASTGARPRRLRDPVHRLDRPRPLAEGARRAARGAASRGPRCRRGSAAASSSSGRTEHWRRWGRSGSPPNTTCAPHPTALPDALSTGTSTRASADGGSRGQRGPDRRLHPRARTRPASSGWTIRGILVPLGRVLGLRRPPRPDPRQPDPPARTRRAAAVVRREMRILRPDEIDALLAPRRRPTGRSSRPRSSPVSARASCSG